MRILTRLAPTLVYIAVFALCISLVVDMPISSPWMMLCGIAAYFLGKLGASLTEQLLGLDKASLHAQLLDQAISNSGILRALLFHLEGVVSKEVCDDIRDRIKATDAVIAKAGGAS